MSMLFGHLLTNRGVMFSDIRTYWSPEAVKRVTGTDLSGAAAGGAKVNSKKILFVLH
jgi:L-fucose isomerase